MARSRSANLILAEQAVNAKPYVYLYLTDSGGTNHADLSARIFAIEHHEQLQNDWAIITLSNYDGTITTDYRGWWFDIAYGCNTSLVGGSGNEVSGTSCSRLWVKQQHVFSAGGKYFTILYCEGKWTVADELLIALGDGPYYQNDYIADTGLTTYYSIIEYIIEIGMGGTLAALAEDDGLISTVCPIFEQNSTRYESMRELIARCLFLTKSYVRAKDGLNFEVKYPQAGDATNFTFYSYQAPFFKTLEYIYPLNTPNNLVVFGNQSATGDWASVITSQSPYGYDTASMALYMTIMRPYIAGGLTTQDSINNAAAALLFRLTLQSSFGSMVVPHNSGVEILDKVQAVDHRVGSTTYPTLSTVRVGGLVHTLQSGKYDLQITWGMLQSDIPSIIQARTEQQALKKKAIEDAKRAVEVAAGVQYETSMADALRIPTVTSQGSTGANQEMTWKERYESWTGHPPSKTRVIVHEGGAVPYLAKKSGSAIKKAGIWIIRQMSKSGAN